MSVCATAMVAANNAVTAPTAAMTVGNHEYDTASSGLTRVIRYTPEVTIVAAWMSADTGVGPAMASGSHTYSGSCADLPHAPTNRSSAIAVAVVSVSLSVCCRKPEPSLAKYVIDPRAVNVRNVASM